MDFGFVVWEIFDFFLDEDTHEFFRLVLFVVIFLVLSGGAKESKKSSSTTNRPLIERKTFLRHIESLGKAWQETKSSAAVAEDQTKEEVASAALPLIEPETAEQVAPVAEGKNIASVREKPRAAEKQNDVPLLTPETALSAIVWSEILRRPRIFR